MQTVCPLIIINNGTNFKLTALCMPTSLLYMAFLSRMDHKCITATLQCLTITPSREEIAHQCWSFIIVFLTKGDKSKFNFLVTII